MAKGRAIVEVSVDAAGAVKALGELSGELGKVATTGQSAASETASFDRRLNNLLNRLDPTRAATQRYERDQKLLNEAFSAGKLTAEQFKDASEKLKARLEAQIHPTSALTQTTDQLLQKWAGISLQGATVIGAIGAVGTALIGSAKAAMEAETANARLEAVIRATGGQAGVTAGEIGDLATEIQRSTGIADEHVKSAAAVLLTYQTINKDIFPKTLSLAADLSVMLGTDMSSAARTLGKALEDPVGSMGALKKAGVVLKPEIEANIKAMVEMGDQAGAQSLLLQELEKRIGGVAVAMGQTAAGSIEIMKQEIGDTAEVIGTTFLPIIKAFTSGVQGLFGAVNELIGQGKSRGLKGVLDTLGDLAVGLGLTSAESVNAGAALLGLKDGAEKARIQVKKVSDVAGETAISEQEMERATKLAVKAFEDEEKRVKELKDRQLTQLKSLIEELNREKSVQIGLVQTLSERYGDYDTLIKLSIPDLEALKSKMELADFMASQHADTVDTELIPALGRWHDENQRLLEDAFIPPPENQSWWQRWKNVWGNAGREAAAALAPALTDGIFGALTGDDAKEAWTGIFEELGRQAQSILSITIGEALKTGSLMQGLQAGGWVSEGGVVNWGQIGTVGGTLLWGYGASRGNRGMGALGGAIAGASMGMTFSPIGAVIGAIIGGVLGYFTSGTKSYGYNVGLNYAGRGIVDITGISQAEEDERLRQLRDTARSYFAGFRSLIELLGVAQPDVLKWSFSAQGKAGDTGQIWKQILAGELPRSIFELYKPAIEQGLAGLGVSAGRMGELMGRFQEGEFQAAIGELQAYIEALLKLKDLHGELSKSLDQLREEWSMTIEERLAKGTQDVLEQISAGISAMQQMTSPEQVARAQELAAAIEQQMGALQAYIQQIFAAQQQAQMQAEAMRFGWAQQEAKAGGTATYAQWLQDQLAALQSQIAGAGDLATAQQAWQRAMGLLQELYSLGGQKGYAGLKDVAKSLLDQLESTYNDTLNKLAEKAKAQLDQLDSALQGIQNVLTQETSLHQQLTQSIQEEEQAQRESRQAEREDMDRFRRAIGDASDASAAAAASVSSLAAAARAAAAAAAAAASAIAQLSAAAGVPVEPEPTGWA